jgi:hypothetical protein
MNGSEDTLPRGQLRTMQIIAGAILAGLLMFLALVLYLVLVQNHGNGLGPGDPPLLSVMALVLLAVNTPLAFVLRGTSERAALRQIAAGSWRPPRGTHGADLPAGGKLLVARQTGMILAMALLEGVGFLACIAYLMEAQPFALAVCGLVVIFLLANFPTEGRVRAWLERQANVLAEMRQ